MSDKLRVLKELLNSQNVEDKGIAHRMLQSGYYEFDEIKDILYEFLKNFEKLPSYTPEEERLKGLVLETIVKNSELIIKNRKQTL